MLRCTVCGKGFPDGPENDPGRTALRVFCSDGSTQWVCCRGFGEIVEEGIEGKRMTEDGGKNLKSLAQALGACECRRLVDTSVYDVLADDGATALLKFFFDGAVLDIRVRVVSYRLLRSAEGPMEVEAQRRLATREKNGE